MTKTLQTSSLNYQTRIGVLYGGLSSEREVSLISGKNCYEALIRLGYQNACLIDVDQRIANTLVEQQIEVAYIALHGKYGEDGCIQGLLELMGLPYTGCRVLSSALTMNKALTKSVLKDAGLPVIDSVVLHADVYGNGQSDQPILLNFSYPVMVKPISEGSSIGMSKVNQPGTMKEALQVAFRYSEEVMVEQYIPGKSITVGIVDVGNTPRVTPILELRPLQAEWYDLEAKYTEGSTQFILPAELPDAVTLAIQDATLKAYLAAGCRGVSRIDFIVDSDHQFYILEINTIPGMTNLSDLPAQAKAMGIDYDQLVECILKTAVHG